MRYSSGKLCLSAALALFISGCVYFRPSSELTIDESLGWEKKSWVYGGVRQNWIYKNDISLMIRPHNYGEYSALTILPVPLIPINSKDIPSRALFAVTLVFDSGINTWQGVPQSLKFNPYKVELRRQNGSSRPVGYIRPSFNNFHCYDFDYEDQSLVNSIEHSKQNEWIGFSEQMKGRCFYLIYDMAPPPPTETFSFKVNELQLEGKALEVPELVFRKGLD